MNHALRRWALAGLVAGSLVAGCHPSAPLICEREGRWYPAGWGFRDGRSRHAAVCSSITNSFIRPADLVIPSEYADGCVVTGCGGELCADAPIVTQCVPSPDRRCYLDHRTCVPGTDGCEWEVDPGLDACLASLADAGTAP